ncbi:MAG: AAA family ATPase [Myxococcota bacterium]|nr:AAA family ATPase [Myxococcota bacterium]
MNIIDQVRAARRVSVPLVAIATPDPGATMEMLAREIDAPALCWDIIRGVRPGNDKGRVAVEATFGDDAGAVTDPAAMLDRATRLPKETVLFVLQAHRYLEGSAAEAVVQAIWNIRDVFKADTRTLVLLGPAFRLPPELAQDVLVLDEALPGADQLRAIVATQYQNAQLEPPEAGVLERAVDALRGLAAFSAEQVTAMSLRKSGLDLDALWERKRRMIEQTPGLSVNRSGETYDDLGGLENAKSFGRRILQGNAVPKAVVFLDEIEKAMAGAAGDSSGVSQDLLASLLTYMQDRSATGIIAVGPPGSGKSAWAKATGNTGQIPTIVFDLGGMKGSLVGQSEANIRAALKVVSAVADDNALWIATCNSVGALPPELRRRFTYGLWFFDLPSAGERKVVWQLYLGKYKLVEQKLPDDDGWTGAEIRVCCDLASRLGCNLTDASSYIVPVARSAARQIEQLRMQAGGRFISASSPGIYRYERTAGAGRAINPEAN